MPIVVSDCVPKAQCHTYTYMFPDSCAIYRLAEKQASLLRTERLEMSKIKNILYAQSLKVDNFFILKII